MYRFLLTRQWVFVTLLALVLVPTMIELGFWQLHRHEARVAQNSLIADSLDAKPVPVEKLTAPGETLPREDYWRQVTATGRFDAEHEVVVRRRTNSDDMVGFHVLTPFVLEDGKVLLVNRGWVPSAADQKAFPKVPPPPTGERTVTGRLMASQTTDESGIKDLKGLPDRQVMLISSEQQAQLLNKEVLGGYIELTDPQTESPEQIPEPDHGSIGNHFAYAIQWWLFTAAVPVGWFFLVRREVRERREASAAQDQAEPVPA